eukprot:8179458-Lingulodinium_polyedra.AAC.1
MRPFSRVCSRLPPSIRLCCARPSLLRSTQRKLSQVSANIGYATVLFSPTQKAYSALRGPTH